MKNLIFGFGVTGKGVFDFFQKHNIPFIVSADESTGIPQNYFQDYNTIDCTKIKQVVISPSVPPLHPFIQKARSAGVPVISDLELFKQYAKPDCKIIGVTGSNGKSTTASLIYNILKTAGKRVFLAGNIGISPLTHDAFEAEYIVLEVSSFQLEYTNFTFDAGVLLNIQSDHLAFHGGEEGYKNVKAKILTNSIFGLKSFECEKSKNLTPALDVATTKILSTGYSYIQNKFYKNGEALFTLPEFTNLKGMHNKQNIAFAISLCLDFIGLSEEEIIKGVSGFVPLKHRIEPVKIASGVEFVNDSKATNPASTITALKCFTGRSIFLIAGGRAKEDGIEVLFKEPCFKYVREVLLIGEASPDFAKKIIQHNKQNPSSQVKYIVAGSLERAVSLAFTSAKKNKNSVVLLSPLCASFDQFKNYEERGEAFKNFVNNL